LGWPQPVWADPDFSSLHYRVLAFRNHWVGPFSSSDAFFELWVFRCPSSKWPFSWESPPQMTHSLIPVPCSLFQFGSPPAVLTFFPSPLRLPFLLSGQFWFLLLLGYLFRFPFPTNVSAKYPALIFFRLESFRGFFCEPVDLLAFLLE